MSFSFNSKPFGTNPTGFGAQPTNTTFGAPQPNTTFGAPQANTAFGTPQPTAGFGAQQQNTFGAQAPANTFAPQQVNSFGAQQPSTFGTSQANTFGAPQANTFGTPQANTAFGAPQTNTFGPQVSTQPNLFGNATTTQATPGLNFGTPAPATSQGFGGFGAAPTPAGNLTFGTPSSVPTGFATAAPASTTFTNPAGLSFGGTPATQSFGLQVAPPKPGLTFGSPATAASLSFGTPVTSASGLSFGAPSTTATGSLSFGTQVTSATPLNFGAPTSTGFSLGGLSAASATPSLNFGAASTALGSGLSFGTTTVPASGLTFGLASTNIPASQPPQQIGLGGIAGATPSTSAALAKSEQSPKDQLLPNEIQQTVENFKNFVKQQKSFSSDVARCSVKEFKKVESDINEVTHKLQEVEKQLELNKSIAEKLKYDTAKGLQCVEMAQRTYDTPIGLQYDNIAPTEFFLELVESFDKEMKNIKMQIENTDKYIKTVGNPVPLTSQDLTLGMKRIHEIFVTLAGRMQMLHNQVELQKEQYLNYRKRFLNDATNVFETPNKESDAIQLALNYNNFVPPKTAAGPTPFNSISHPNVVQAVAQNNPPPMYPANTFGGFSAGTQLFGNAGFGQSFNMPNLSSGFQLQKPPTGNKRGKQ